MMLENIYCDGLDCINCLNTECPKTVVIIDDVNVKNCKYYRFEKCAKIGVSCSSEQNCYYKQLMREIKKNENLLKIFDARKKTIEILARENENLKNVHSQLLIAIKSKDELIEKYSKEINKYQILVQAQFDLIFNQKGKE